MANKTYGERKISYEVVEGENGWIDLLVCHDNKEIRGYLKSHKPQYFFKPKRREQYKSNNITAKKWLARVIDDYPSCFEKGRVKFVLKSPCS